MSAHEISGPQYHPRSITVELRTINLVEMWCVVDASMRNEDGEAVEHVHPYGPGEWKHLQAERAARVRRGVIKAALTRRRNKRLTARREACEAAGVTWPELTTGEGALTVHEADAWLGLD